jgi:hypothetical protein
MQSQFIAAAALLALSSPALAQGVETPEQAVAEFRKARESGVTALTNSEGLRCAGYWLALEKIHGIAKDDPFWSGMPLELSQGAALIKRQAWGAHMGAKTENNPAAREADNRQVQAYYDEAIRKVAAASETGRIKGLFEWLGYCDTIPQ